MATIDDFKIGQRVAHISVGDGTVEAIEDGCLVVKFDRTSGKRQDHFMGKYDRRWFEIHPKFLFHRTSSDFENAN